MISGPSCLFSKDVINKYRKLQNDLNLANVEDGTTLFGYQAEENSVHGLIVEMQKLRLVFLNQGNFSKSKT